MAKPYTTTDARFRPDRFAPQRGRASAEARRYGPAGAGSAKAGEATRRAQFDAANRKNQYVKKPIISTEKTARE